MTIVPFDTNSRVENVTPMKKKESKFTKIKNYVSSKVNYAKNLDYKAIVSNARSKIKTKIISEVKRLPDRYNKVENFTKKTGNKLVKDISKSIDTKEINKVNKKLGSSLQRSFTQNKLSGAQLQAYRKAKAARLQQEQYQRATSIQQSGWDNKFEREFAHERFLIDEEERRRRFHEVPRDLLLRRDMLWQLRHQRAREGQARDNMFKAHEMMPKVHIRFLDVDSTTNLLRSAPIWRQDNPDNNVFRDTGRPTILDTPNTFQQTDLTRSMNILNAPALNFGKVDTTRKRRRFIQQREERF